MPEAKRTVGEWFPVQFVWQLPDGDYIRAVFRAQILDIIPAADKYLVQLEELLAGRQESKDGEMRPKEKMTIPYWVLVRKIIGNKVTLAYEVDNGRPLHMRLTTLIGKHDFFTRYNKYQTS
ncbi:MAG: hypothetical protein GY805_27050 [Chloroflexi bacterium]|nr:hypothetical protein [Chloroflexota bacterium]